MLEISFPSHGKIGSKSFKWKKKVDLYVTLKFYYYYINTYYMHVLLKRLDYTKSKSEMKKKVELIVIKKVLPQG